MICQQKHVYFIEKASKALVFYLLGNFIVLNLHNTMRVVKIL